MAPSKIWYVTIDGEVFYSGPFRSADLIYSAVVDVVSRLKVRFPPDFPLPALCLVKDMI